MMNRRNFIRTASLTVAAGILAPKTALASHNRMAGGLYYTKEHPGRWAKKVAGHFPSVEVTGKKLKVTTAHGMTGYKHYIVKHQILDKNYHFLNEKMFDPMKDKTPVSEFDLGNYSGKIYVLSVCNKHDTWMNSATV